MQKSIYRRGVWVLLIVLSLLGVFACISHYYLRPTVAFAVANHISPGPAWYTEQLPLYDQHALMTFIHLVPAAIFMLLAPVQFSRRLQQRFTWLHRLIGRSLLVLGLFLAAAGIVIGVVMPFAGLCETIVSLIIGAGFLFSGYMGFRAIRQKNISQHRKWMSYLLAFAYTPMVMRIVLIVLIQAFAVDGQRIFAESLLVSMLINIAVVYWWLRKKPRQSDVAGNGVAYDF